MDDNKIIKSINNLLYNLKKANYKVNENIGELLNNVSKYDEKTNYDILNFKATNEETNVDCHIIYRTFYRINKTNLENNTKNVVSDLKENDFIILVVSDEYSLDTMHSYLKYEYDCLNSESPYIHIFNLNSLQFKILDHKFVPKHIVLNETEKEEFYKKYNIKSDSQIPEISRFDPVANAIFLKPGQICKILRYDKTSFVNEYYRICI